MRYTYTKTVNTERLATEIESALGLVMRATNGEPVDGHIETTDTDCIVVTNSTLSGQNKLILDSVIQRHVPGLEPNQTVNEKKAVRVQVDPGTPETDPRWYNQQALSIVGSTQFDAPASGLSGKYLQGVSFQLAGHTASDTVSVYVLSNGTKPTIYGPAGTTLASFGTVSPRMVCSGWGHRDIMYQTSKLIDTGWKVSVALNQQAGNTVHMLLDWLVHE